MIIINVYIVLFCFIECVLLLFDFVHQQRRWYVVRAIDTFSSWSSSMMCILRETPHLFANSWNETLIAAHLINISTGSTIFFFFLFLFLLSFHMSSSCLFLCNLQSSCIRLSIDITCLVACTQAQPTFTHSLIN